MLLPLATVLGLTGCSYVRDPAVSERRALPARMGYTKKEESVRGDWTGTDSLLLAWWLFFLELATLNWSSEIY